MRVVKPASLGVLSRPYEFQRQFHLGVAVLAFMPMAAKPALLAETAMWAFLAENLPPDAVLDAAIPKQGAEYLAIGHAYAPGGRPVTLLEAEIRLGEARKVLHVTGDRLWDGSSATAPGFFKEMSLGWERAYGAKDFAENPLGMGADGLNATPQQPVKLPNIVATSGEMRRPVGFGPVDQTWPQRLGRVGTHDDAWLKGHFPGFAPDIDWRFFNAGQPDQWFDAPLTGRETYALKNLHPEKPLLTGQLPGLAPRAFITRKGQDGLQEIPLALTTIWFFPDQERLVLVHHGRAAVAEEDASDIENFMMGADAPGPSRPASAFRAVMDMRLDRSNPAAGLHALNDAQLVPADWVVPDPALAAAKEQVGTEGIAQSRIYPRLAREHAAQREKLQARGLDPDKYMAPLPVEEPPPVLTEIPAFIEKQTALAAAKKTELVAKAAELAGKFPGRSPDMAARPKGPPVFTAALARARLEAVLAKADAMGAAVPHVQTMLADPETGQRWLKAQADSREAYRQTAHHQDRADQAAPAQSAALRYSLTDATISLRDPGAQRLPYDLHGIDLSGIDLSHSDFSGLCLDGANLAGCNFSHARLREAVLAHADLRGCIFNGADLRGANLGAADLTGARLAGGNLQKAIFAKADLTKAVFDGADATGADFSEAKFSGTSLKYVKAVGLVLMRMAMRDLQAPGIDLTKASFIEVDFTGALFSHATLASVAFIGCKLDAANFTGADVSKAVFVNQCSLENAQFTGANLTGACLREAALSGSDFTQANLEKTDFSKADLNHVKLPLVRAVEARFTAANLRNALLTQGNFWKADFARADLRAADLGQGGFTDANLARAQIDAQTNRLGMQTTRMRYLPLHRAP